MHSYCNMERRLFYIAYFYALVSLISALPLTEPGTKTTTLGNDTGSGSNHVTYINTAAAVVKKCSLVPDNDTLAGNIAKVLEDGTTMIEFKLKFRGDEWLPVNVSGKATSKMFKPFFWVRTTGRFGTRLLLLKPNYDIMSFTSLEMQVKKFKRIHLNEFPPNCMDNLQYDDVEQILRELVMNNFQNTSDTSVQLDSTDNVCNLHVRDIDGADFRYYCCHRDGNMKMTCDYLQSDIWLLLMRLVIRLIKALFILFCPLLIPTAFFYQISDDDCFRYTLEKPHRIMLQLVQGTSKPADETRRTDSVVKQEGQTINMQLSKIRHMTKLKAVVQGLQINETKSYEVHVAELQTRGKRLINTGEAPSRIFSTLYEFLFNCRVRELKSVNACCDTDMCTVLPCIYTWFNFGRMFTRFLLLILLITPWVIRVFVYYHYEHEELTWRKEAAHEKGFVFPFPGNITWYLSPLHGLFIFIYAAIALEAIVYGNLTKKIKTEVKFLFRKCNQDMLRDSRTKAFGEFVRLLCLPFTTLGSLVIFGGVFMWAVLIPLGLIYLVFHIFPTVNLTVRLFLHFVVYALPVSTDTCSDSETGSNSGSPQTDNNEDTEPETHGSNNVNSMARCLNYVPNVHTWMKRKLWSIVGNVSQLDRKRYLGTLCGRLSQLVITLLCLIGLYSCMVLLFELATFFLDIFLYTLIGFIIYARDTMTYISLSVLLLVYGKDCFGSVSRRYRQYSSTLNTYIMSICEGQALSSFYEDSTTQKNRAFVVKPCLTKEDPCEKNGWKKPDHNDVKLTNESNHLTWNVRKVAFFLTKHDVPKIPSKLLFEAGVMPYPNSPGRVLHQYLAALLNFSYIVAFLLFVFLVVMAFGESGTLSVTNQLLATIAGGILPFLLKKFIFKSHDNHDIDVDKDINFRVAVHNLINEYEQNWLVHDIDAIETTRIEPGSSEVCDDERRPETQPGSNSSIQTKANGSINALPSKTNESYIECPPKTNGSDMVCPSKTNGEHAIFHRATNGSHVVDGTVDADVTKLVFEFKESDVDKFDFPRLYERLNLANVVRTPDTIPLTVVTETA